MLTLSKLKRHIKRCKAKDKRFDFLGLVENEDLTKEVEALFTLDSYSGVRAYDWVNGNNELKELIK